MLAESDIGEVLVVEPNIEVLPSSFDGLNIKLVTIDEAISQANTLAVLVDHKEFKEIDPAEIAKKVIIDSRGIFK
jgi:UDP-N-acetyl-D-mannosaminuronic acid dehydrogenase